MTRDPRFVPRWLFATGISVALIFAAYAIFFSVRHALGLCIILTAIFLVLRFFSRPIGHRVLPAYPRTYKDFYQTLWLISMVPLAFIAVDQWGDSKDAKKLKASLSMDADTRPMPNTYVNRELSDKILDRLQNKRPDDFIRAVTAITAREPTTERTGRLIERVAHIHLPSYVSLMLKRLEAMEGALHPGLEDDIFHQDMSLSGTK